MTPRVRGLLCDLDGVVFRGSTACPGAIDGLQSARESGVELLFITNNASRSPEAVAAHLNEVGVPARSGEVLTAAQVAAAVLAERRTVAPEDSREAGIAPVLVVGGPGIGAALDAAGLPWVDASASRTAYQRGEQLSLAALLQGYGPEVCVADLAEATYAVSAGVPWIATNDDATLPTERGQAPGNGSLLAAVAHATGASPEVVGKPHPPAYRVALARLGLPASACLMIGDRLETDIAGAAAAGLSSALVLTGVSTAAEAAALPPAEQPTYVAATISDLAHLWEHS